ncbi:MAG: redoxin domain-containing protein, partial [bacterium]|nr:redoxin domain-containing protein [bacterium]
VLVFYPGDDTPVCKKQLCEMRDKWALFEEKGVVVFGVNPQSEESHKKFRERYDFPFPLLVDSAKRVAAAYKAKGLIVRRTVYLIDKAGIIRYAKRGKPAVEEILKALE